MPKYKEYKKLSQEAQLKKVDLSPYEQKKHNYLTTLRYSQIKLTMYKLPGNDPAENPMP